jgi:diguanylate cyclase (GGDEF)-like protein
MDTCKLPLSPEDLARLPLFEGERPDALQWLLEYCSVEQFPADHALLRPDQDNDVLYVVLHGRVRVQLDARGKKVLAYMDEGQCIGEMSIIEGVPPSAVVVTDTDCTLLGIRGTALRALIFRSHVVARNLLFTLSSRLRNDNLLIVQSLQQQHIYEQHSKADALTGLHNRRWLSEALETLIGDSDEEHPLSVLMIDLDHFKHYNDTHGHLAGDCALAATARAVARGIRDGDAAVRYGGEELIVIMPNTGSDEALTIAERLRTAVYKQVIFSKDNAPLPGVTASIGVATRGADQSADALLAAADAALYRAKAAGRDQVAL